LTLADVKAAPHPRGEFEHFEHLAGLVWKRFRESGEKWEFDAIDFATLLDGIEFEADRVASGSGAATHSDDFRSVDWFGTRYSFTATQAACIRVLWDNWERKTPEVGDATILTAAESNSERLGIVFRDHKAWGTMIVEGVTKGTHGLHPPAG
jgi:hypothetical protein